MRSAVTPGSCDHLRFSRAFIERGCGFPGIGSISGVLEATGSDRATWQERRLAQEVERPVVDVGRRRLLELLLARIEQVDPLGHSAEVRHGFG